MTSPKKATKRGSRRRRGIHSWTPSAVEGRTPNIERSRDVPEARIDTLTHYLNIQHSMLNVQWDSRMKLQLNIENWTLNIATSHLQVGHLLCGLLESTT